MEVKSAATPVKSGAARITSEPPTVDIKSKQATSQNSGDIVLNPPSAAIGC